MKITGNENGKVLTDTLINKKELEQFDKVIATTKILFGSINLDIILKKSDFNTGEFEIGLVANVMKDIPDISVSIDNAVLAKDLFYNSNKSEDNRVGILEYLKQGLINSIDEAFKDSNFIQKLEEVDEKLKSKTQEVRTMDIYNNDLSKIEEAPQLTTGDTLKEVIEEELPFPEVEKLDITASIAEGYKYSEDEEDDEMPSNYKPLSDSTNDNHSINKEDEGVFESIGKIKH